MKILIEDLTFDAIIGILDHERIAPQQVCIDCSIDYPYTNGHYINYAQVVQAIEKTMIDEQFELIETALEVLTSTLKKDFPLIQELSLTIHKPDILSNCTVGVEHKTIF